MSNIIKSKHVYMNSDETKIINSDDKMNQLFMINLNKVHHASSEEYAATDEGTFREGLAAEVIDRSNDEYNDIVQEELNQKCNEILANAKKEAEEIINKAKLESKKVCDLLYEQANKKGYDDGMIRAESKIETAKKHFEDQEKQLQDDYKEQINNLEPEFCNVLMDLIQKITGVVIEDKKEVILYLIHNAILHADNSLTYNIKVSIDDYDFVLSKKDELLELASRDSVIIDIILDRKLIKNQCLIETDSRIIDCSLDTQLSGLTQDIKLLSVQWKN